MARYAGCDPVASAAGLAGRRPEATSAQDLQVQSGAALHTEHFAVARGRITEIENLLESG